MAALVTSAAPATPDEPRAPGDLRADGLAVDPAAGPGSDGNGVAEPGEGVVVAPAWRNTGPAPLAVTGTASGYIGPGTPGLTYAITDPLGQYGTIDPGQGRPCTDCYAVTVPSGPRPADHWDAVFGERLSDGTLKSWLLHVGLTFADVPRSSPFYRFVETLVHTGVTGGCGASSFCPASLTTRAQLAVFVLSAREGRWYAPPLCQEGAATFADVPASSPFCPWIEELARRGVAGGCGGNNYCPGNAVSREQMAVFTLLTREGSGYLPPACVAGSELFADVPASSPFCRWIEELARRGVVGGCGGGNYCPGSPVTREQMSVFLSLTFGLALYGPNPGVQVVTNTADDTVACTPAGCSLRAAITAVDAGPNPGPGRDELRFLIPGAGPHTIRPAVPLPELTLPVVVDGYSQPGAVPNSRMPPDGLDTVLKIELDGSFSSTAVLRVAASGVLVRGLAIGRGPDRGVLFTAPNSTLEGCFVGTNLAGNAAAANRISGVEVSFVNAVRIGGPRPAARNLISGNTSSAVAINGGSNNVVQGNLIGTNASATSALPNGGGVGIAAPFNLTFADSNEVGGLSPGVSNVIAGNQGGAVSVEAYIAGDHLTGAFDNRIRANFIGHNGRGTIIPNGSGVTISGNSANSTLVGGDSLGFPAGNSIVGNTGAGVLDSSVNARIQGNLISGNATGVAIALVTPFGAGSGALVSGNTITGNAGAGVQVADGRRNTVRQNSIHGNGALGLDLAPAGVTPNDTGDGDTGANELQNFPVLASAQVIAGGVVVGGTLNSRASASYQVDFYVSAAADPSGFGEGERYLGTAVVTTDAAGNAAFNATLGGPVAAGQLITATATDANGNTSEFSAALPVS